MHQEVLKSETLQKHQSVEKKLKDYQKNADECIKKVHNEKEWKSKMKNIRFDDMEENKRHIQRLTQRKNNKIISRQKSADTKIRVTRTTGQQFIKNKL